jgi:hypothetical protein
LLARIHFFHQHLPPEFALEMGRKSATEITFPSLNSSFYIGTARSMTFGRGDRIDRAHLSELAFYEDGERIVNAIEEAVPLHGTITAECSPNGEGNTFYDMWVRARMGRSGYKPFFFPWWLGKDYAIPRGSGFALIADQGEITKDMMTGEELDLVEKFSLTEDQLRWRRRKLADKGGLFYQEYPEDEITCFQTSGDPVFDPNLLSSMAKMCYEGERHPQGFFVWKPPVEGERYIIGADCSEGWGEKSSFSAACVLDSNWNVCATYQSRVPPKFFATTLMEMGNYYNNARLAIERNAQGYAVLSESVDKYPNLYYQTDLSTGRQSTRTGWWTNDASKTFMVTKFRDMLPQMGIWDANLIRQARAWRLIKGKPKAQTYDDLLIATMIAVAVQATVGTARGYLGSVEGWDF